MEFVNCSLAFVTQMNMIIRFAGVMPVRSIQAPYRCPSCDRENVRVLDVRGDIAAQLNVRLPCVCGGRLEFDELLENYFAFLRPAAAPR